MRLAPWIATLFWLGLFAPAVRAAAPAPADLLVTETGADGDPVVQFLVPARFANPPIHEFSPAGGRSSFFTPLTPVVIGDALVDVVVDIGGADSGARPAFDAHIYAGGPIWRPVLGVKGGRINELDDAAFDHQTDVSFFVDQPPGRPFRPAFADGPASPADGARPPFVTGGPDAPALTPGVYAGRNPVSGHAATVTISRVRESGRSPSRDAVYFIGDSVTAGFGYCGRDTVGAFHDCRVDAPFDDSWGVPNLVAWGLRNCAPRTKRPLNDACSNNNDGGDPFSAAWNSRPWRPGSKAPSIAYSYVIAQDQSRDPAPADVFNLAVTGSTPADWDPVAGGGLSRHLLGIHDAYVVMTLGANPLLSSYLAVDFADLKVKKGACSSSTFVTPPGGGAPAIATPLSVHAGADGAAQGVGRCLTALWDRLQQSDHLDHVFRTLLANGNRVVVVGYPPVCAWAFGLWQPAANILSPATGKTCEGRAYPTAAGGAVNQAQQAFYLGQLVNGLIYKAVLARDDTNIIFVAPSRDWRDHQAWTDTDPTAPGSEVNSWIFKNDTWVHPSRLGHRQIATAVEAAMCRVYGRWCPRPGAEPGEVIWSPAPAARTEANASLNAPASGRP